MSNPERKSGFFSRLIQVLVGIPDEDRPAWWISRPSMDEDGNYTYTKGIDIADLMVGDNLFVDDGRVTEDEVDMIEEVILLVQERDRCHPFISECEPSVTHPDGGVYQTWMAPNVVESTA